MTERQKNLKEWKAAKLEGNQEPLMTAENYKDTDALQMEMDAEEERYEVDEAQLTAEQKILREEREKLDEWVWLTIKFLLENFASNGAGNSTLGFIFDLLNQRDLGSVEKNMTCDLSHPLKLFLNYLHLFFQKTVEQKVKFSLVREFPARMIENDEFFTDHMQETNAGIEISLADLNYILTIIDFNFSELQNLDTQNTEGLSPSAAQWLTEKLHAAIANIHWMVKLLIPITILGNYNAPLQDFLFPRILVKFGKILGIINRNFYMRKIDLPDNVGYEINSNILRLAGNLVHVNRTAQDLVVDQKLLNLYVGFTKLDYMNPSCKECTIVFIRYMSESNQTARDY